MKRILLIVLFIGFNGYSQETFNIDWQQGVNGTAANLDIAVGDIVTWTWANGSPHDVTSKIGSTETFNSETIAEMGFVFSYTFTQEGVNQYICSVHPESMFGTITVSGTLSVDERFAQNLKLYPTNVDTQAQLTSLYEVQDVAVYSTNGTKVYESINANSNLINFDFSSLSSGLYFMKLNTLEGQQSTLKFLKK